MHVGETLSRLRREAGLSQGDAAAYLTGSGCPCNQKSLSKWERGVNLPNAEQLLLLCRLYGVRDVLHCFFGMEDELSRLNPLGRRRVEEYIRLLAGDESFAAEPPILRRRSRAIPLYDLPVSAGTGQFLDSSDHRLLEIGEEAPQGRGWSWWTDLNPRPADYKSAALPTELHQHEKPHHKALFRCRTGDDVSPQQVIGDLIVHAT